MTKKPASKKAPPKKKTKKEISDLKFNRRREWRFDLPLRAEVEGKLPQGKKFKEDITLNNISCQGAYFCLDSGVMVGSKLNLVIEKCFWLQNILFNIYIKRSLWTKFFQITWIATGN